jgi:hypothetical protein
LAPAFAAALLCIAVLASARSASAQRYVVVYGPPPPPPPPPTRYYYAGPPTDDGPDQALNLGVDLEGAAPINIGQSPDGNAVRGGGGIKVRVGQSFRLAPGFRIVPEVGWGYDHLWASDDISGISYAWDMHRLFGGARLEFGRYLVPSLYAHVGYGWRTSGDVQYVADASGVAFDAGGALDLRVFRHLSLGAHLEYGTIDATPYQPEWIAAGVHADVIF